MLLEAFTFLINNIARINVDCSLERRPLINAPARLIAGPTRAFCGDLRDYHGPELHPRRL